MILIRSRGVDAHFTPRDGGWMTYVDRMHQLLAPIVGAKNSEVACMGTLTANLNLLMNAFYRPTTTRYKILCEANAFPSDQVRDIP
jgi:kynureninase